MHIKICGLKSYESAVQSFELGADLLGFNFYPPSPRYIDPQDCRLLVSRMQYVLTRSVHQLKLVGVFVNETLSQVQQIMEDCRLDLAQLSGDEPPEMLEALGERAFKAVRLSTAGRLRDELRRYPKRASEPSWLVDAYQPGAYGGTGQTADWSLARDLAADVPILLAGGLNPRNVGEALRQVRPWGVDVASGVESSPGCKDLEKIQAFVNAVRFYEQEA